MATAPPVISLDTLRSIQILSDSQARELEPLAQQQPWPVVSAELVSRGWVTNWQLDALPKKDGPKLAFGSYLLLDQLGQGGRGAVYKARHRRLKRVVALKVINPDLLVHDDVVQRFHREAEAAARLDHPNIVRVYDADEDGGIHFIAMEFVEG